MTVATAVPRCRLLAGGATGPLAVRLVAIGLWLHACGLRDLPEPPPVETGSPDAALVDIATGTDSVESADAQLKELTDVAIWDSAPDVEWPDSSWPYALADAAKIDVADLPTTCTEVSPDAAWEPGDPTLATACWTWLRTGGKTDWERVTGEIAVYSPAPVAVGDLMLRHVFAADGTLLTDDQAAPLAEQLTPVGNGYTQMNGKLLEHFDATGQLAWSKLLPLDGDFGVDFSGTYVMEGPKLSPFASGNVLAYGYLAKAGTKFNPLATHLPGYFIATPAGELLLDTLDKYWQKLLVSYSGTLRVWDGLILRSSHTSDVNQSWTPAVIHFRDGVPGQKRFEEVTCEIAGGGTHSDCSIRSYDVWAGGDLLTCGNNCPESVTDNAKCAGKLGGGYEGTAVGRLERYGSTTWSLPVLCEVAAVRPDGAIVGYGRIAPNGPRTWFQVGADGTGLTALPYPKKYVPTTLHRSVSGGMYMAGHVEENSLIGAAWVGRSALDGCLPLACSVQ